MSQSDQVFRIQRERCLENGLRFWQTFGLEQRLPEDNVPAHVAGLLREILLADEDGLVEIACLAVFVGERGKISTGILVEFLAKLLDSR